MDTDRNIYRNEIDFSKLASQFPSLAKLLKPNGQLDFSNPQAVQELSKGLLIRDFGIEVELPDDRLCPPVPNRFNYILWLQDLLDTTGDGYRDTYEPARQVIGLDMWKLIPLIAAREQAAYTLYWGVLSGQNGLLLLQVRQVSGAGLLPLLMSKDIDEKNLEYARKNVALNDLQSRIRIIPSIPSGPLVPLDNLQIESVDFTMCNPPFYESTEEMISCAKEKKRPPFSACTGASVEMVTAGGEVAFVERMIKESLALRERVGWYTTMLGKFSSVSVVVGKLKEVGVQNWAITEFVQGTKTRRWAVGWSWGDMHPRMDVTRGVTTLPKHLLPFPSELTLHVPLVPPDEMGKRLDITLKSLPLHWQWRPAQAMGVGFARENVWSRASRRKGQGPLGEIDKGDDDEPAIGFKVQVRSNEEDVGSEVRVRWMKGRDTVLFESFCGMLKRKAMVVHDDS